ENASRIAANLLKSEKHCPPNLGVRNLAAAVPGGLAADNVADLPILLWRLRQRRRGDTWLGRAHGRRGHALGREHLFVVNSQCQAMRETGTSQLLLDRVARWFTARSKTFFVASRKAHKH